jgi:hypothetical protein
MLLEELETQLLALTPTEKAEVIRLLAQSLSNSWPGITKTPDVCGGDACIAKTRIPVWLLRKFSPRRFKRCRTFTILSPSEALPI